MLLGYGPTEATIESALRRYSSPAPSYNIGAPLANQTIYILSRTSMLLVDFGTIGELCIGGAGVSLGYNNRDITKFPKDPFMPNVTALVSFCPPHQGCHLFGRGRVYCTGDLAYWDDDGRIVYVGRVGSMIKLRGYRVDVEEVEAVLRSSDSRVLSAVVRAVKPAHADIALCAFVRVAGLTSVSNLSIDNHRKLLSDLRSQLRRKLPLFMMPSRVIFLDAYPMTRNGKLDVEQLTVLAHCSAFASPQEDAKPEHNEIPSQSEAREIVASVLSQHRQKNVSSPADPSCTMIDSDGALIQYGMDSLSALRISALLLNRLGCDIRPAAILQCETLRHFLELVSGWNAEHSPTKQWPPGVYDDSALLDFELPLVSGRLEFIAVTSRCFSVSHTFSVPVLRAAWTTFSASIMVFDRGTNGPTNFRAGAVTWVHIQPVTLFLRCHSALCSSSTRILRLWVCN